MALKNITNLHGKLTRLKISPKDHVVPIQPEKENITKKMTPSMKQKKSLTSSKFSMSAESSIVTRSRSESSTPSSALSVSPRTRKPPFRQQKNRDVGDLKNLTKESTSQVVSMATPSSASSESPWLARKRPFQLQKTSVGDVANVTRESTSSDASFLSDSTPSENLRTKPFMRRANEPSPTQSFADLSYAGSESDSVVSENSSLFKIPTAPRLFKRKRKIISPEDAMSDVSLAYSDKEISLSADDSTCSSVVGCCMPFKKAQTKSVHMQDLSIEESVIEDKDESESLSDSSPAQRNMFRKRRKTDSEPTGVFADMSMASSLESDLRDSDLQTSEIQADESITPKSDNASITRASVKLLDPKWSETIREEQLSDVSIHMTSLNASLHSETSEIGSKRPFSGMNAPEKTLMDVSIAKSPADAIESPVSQEVCPRPFSTHHGAIQNFEEVGFCPSQEEPVSRTENQPDGFTTPSVSGPLTRSRTRNMSASLLESAAASSTNSRRRGRAKKSTASCDLNTSSTSNNSNVFNTPAIVSRKTTPKLNHSVTPDEPHNQESFCSSNASSSGRGPVFSARGNAEMLDVTYCVSQPETDVGQSTSLSSTQVQNRPFSKEPVVDDSIDCISFCGSQPLSQSIDKGRPFSKATAQHKSMADISMTISPNLNGTQDSNRSAEGMVAKPFARASANDESLPEIALALSQNSDSSLTPREIQNQENVTPNGSQNMSLNASLINRRKSKNRSLRVLVLERAPFRRMENASFAFPNITMEESDSSDASKSSNESKESSDESSKAESSESSSSEESSVEEEEEEEEENIEPEVEEEENIEPEVEEQIEEPEPLEECSQPEKVDSALVEEELSLLGASALGMQTVIEDDPLRRSVNIPPAMDKCPATRECSVDDTAPHDDLTPLSLESTAMSNHSLANNTVMDARPNPFQFNLENKRHMPPALLLSIEKALKEAEEKDRRMRMQFTPPKQSPPARKKPAGAKKAPSCRIKKYKPDYWANGRLYKYLENALAPVYKLDRVLQAEKIVKTMHTTHQKVMKSKTRETAAINELKLHLAREKIVRTTDDFYKFIDTYMPSAFCDKVIPCLVPFTGIIWPPDVGHKRPDEPILD